MLTGAEILRRVEEGTINITEFNRNQLNPNSYNLRLGNDFLIYDLRSMNLVGGIPTEAVLDSKRENPTIEFRADEGSGIILYPGRLYLACTKERTWAKDLIPCISGRSSFARLGVQIHQTAGFGDIGFDSTWTLEITVVHPVRIYPGQEICQIYFEEPTGEINQFYNGKYQHSENVVASKSFTEY